MKRLLLLCGVLFTMTGCGGEIDAAVMEEPKEQVSFSENESILEVHYIDVGQADCILLESQGQYMLIDGGNNDDDDLIVTYLQDAGVKKLDYVIGTHPHEDHIGALDAVIQEFDVENVFMPKIMHTSKTFEDVLNAVAEKGLKVKAPAPGTEFSFNGLPVEVFGPMESYDDFNNNSIVLKMTAGERSFLFTGDAEVRAEEDMMAAGMDLQADVLKVGHHGSDSSSSVAFLQEVNPSYAVISVGTENKYGHPMPEILKRIKQMGIETYRTDLNGTIFCRTDGKNLVFSDTEGILGTITSDSTQKETDVYFGNKKTKKFHMSSCGSLPSEQNRISFESREDAIQEGYEPCGSCKP